MRSGEEDCGKNRLKGQQKRVQAWEQWEEEAVPIK